MIPCWVMLKWNSSPVNFCQESKLKGGELLGTLRFPEVDHRKIYWKPLHLTKTGFSWVFRCPIDFPETKSEMIDGEIGSEN